MAEIIMFTYPLSLWIRRGHYYAQTWKNEILSWNASDYGGSCFILLPVDEVWIPDVILFNRLFRLCIFISLIIILHKVRHFVVILCDYIARVVHSEQSCKGDAEFSASGSSEISFLLYLLYPHLSRAAEESLPLFQLGVGRWPINMLMHGVGWSCVEKLLVEIDRCARKVYNMPWTDGVCQYCPVVLSTPKRSRFSCHQIIWCPVRPKVVKRYHKLIAYLWTEFGLSPAPMF